MTTATTITQPVMMRLVGSLAPTCARPASSTAMIEHAEEGVDHRAAPAHQAGAADDHGRDHLQLDAEPAFGSAASSRELLHQPGQRGQQRRVIANTMMRIGRGSMPASRIASSLVPMPTT